MGTGTGSPGKWSQDQPERVQEGFGECSQAQDVILGMSCARPEVGPYGPHGFLPNQHILCCYDSKKIIDQKAI